MVPFAVIWQEAWGASWYSQPRSRNRDELASRSGRSWLLPKGAETHTGTRAWCFRAQSTGGWKDAHLPGQGDGGSQERTWAQSTAPEGL